MGKWIQVFRCTIESAVVLRLKEEIRSRWTIRKDIHMAIRGRAVFRFITQFV